MNLCILYLANRKHIRILSLEILEIEFDVAHLTVNIPIGNNGLGATDEPLLVIHAINFRMLSRAMLKAFSLCGISSTIWSKTCRQSFILSVCVMM